MARAASQSGDGGSGNGRANGRANGRKSIHDLAPLELECMNALWPLGEATVHDIRAALLAVRPRAYTTIMTIMDRLAQKGAVERRKSGRAWLYRPTVSAEQARERALEQIVRHFFAGSEDALRAHLHEGAVGHALPAPAMEPQRAPRPAVPPTPRPSSAPTRSAQPATVLDDSLL